MHQNNSALTYGVEWNYRIDAARDPDAFARFSQEAQVLFESESIPAEKDVVDSYSKEISEIPHGLKKT